VQLSGSKNKVFFDDKFEVKPNKTRKKFIFEAKRAIYLTTEEGTLDCGLFFRTKEVKSFFKLDYL
jgi:hypothetical protein